MKSCCYKTCDVCHIYHQICTNLICDFTESLEIQEYIDLYEQQKKADPSNAANYDSDIDRMNRLLQTTSKQRENAGDYSADEYMGTVIFSICG